MNIQTRREIHFGMSALALAGLLFTLSVIIRGPLDRDPAVLMQAVLSPNFVPGVVIGLIGGVLSIYGNFFGLYRYLTFRENSLIPFLAMLLSPLALIMFVLPFVTFLAINMPVIAELYQHGNQEVSAVFETTFTNPLSLGLLSTTSVAGLIGTLLSQLPSGRMAGCPSGWLSRGLRRAFCSSYPDRVFSRPNCWERCLRWFAAPCCLGRGGRNP